MYGFEVNESPLAEDDCFMVTLIYLPAKITCILPRDDG